jgi:carbonic anhydrase/acetyltransferase-like protein (isoleucine patch superfamily)
VIYSLGERAPELEARTNFVADNATVIGNVRLKSGASIWFNCVLRGDNDTIDVGEDSNIQDGCVLHTDQGFPLAIGKGVTVGHAVVLHGCTIGDNSLIGIGSTILNGAVVGHNCLVGANSLITEGKSFPDGSLILGSPAKAVRSLSDAEIASNAESAAGYVHKAARFLAELRPSM